MKMIYEPITEFGKKIAGLLRFDDGVRLDIHDYLEEVEPGFKKVFDKAERWDAFLVGIIEHGFSMNSEAITLSREFNEALLMTHKTKAIRKILVEAEPDDPYVGEATTLQKIADEMGVNKAFDVDRINGVSEFTTKGDNDE